MAQTLVSIGKIAKPVGLKGKVKVILFSTGSKSLESAKTVYLRRMGEPDRKFDVETSSLKHAYATLKLKGVENAAKAKDIVDFELLIDSQVLAKLGDCEFYHYELLGSDVYTDEGKYLGKLENIFSTGSNDVLVIKKNGKEFLVPFIEDVIKNIDIDKKNIEIKPLEGMFE